MSNVKDSRATALRLFLITIGTLLGSMLLGQLVLLGVFTVGEVDVATISEGGLSAGTRQALRLGLFFNNLLMFTVSAAVALRIVYGKRWLSAVQLDRGPVEKSPLYAVAFFVVALPAVAYAAYLNLQLPLPDWAVRSEESTDHLLVQVLTMEFLPEFLLAVLTVGGTAGLGEELLLRGVLQNKILGSWLKNHHLAIFIAAAVFSAMHVEFAGFVPRLLLGMALGYAYYWSQSLWVPIGLHFVFNSFQVVVVYVTGEYDPSAANEDVPSWYLALASVVLSITVAVYAERKFKHEKTPPTPEDDDLRKHLLV